MGQGRLERTISSIPPVTKVNLARLARKWYIVGKDRRPIREMRASMIRRIQSQHKAYMNSLKISTISEAFENIKLEEFTQGEDKRSSRRSRKKVEKANSKVEGEGDHVPQTPNPGKYKVLKRMQKSMVRVPTPGWNLKSICFGTIPFRNLEQLHDFNTIEEEEAPELMLRKDAQAWMDQFLCQIGEKKERTPGRSNFHVNMTYILSSMFCAEPNQPAVMEDDYLAQDPMMALVNIEKVSKEKSSFTDLPNPT
ncbi:hypothetical protein ACFX1Q_023255 [Malus domestica]